MANFGGMLRRQYCANPAQCPQEERTGLKSSVKSTTRV